MSTLENLTDRNVVAMLQAAAIGRPRIVDVSRFKLGDRCPRCIDRRVYAVDENKNLWLCIANAMPVPWRRDQVTEHDATQDHR